MLRLNLLSVLILLPIVRVAPLVAQGTTGGSVTFHVKAHVPDSVAAMTGSPNVDTRMTVATDGQRFAMDIELGTTGPTAGMHVKMIFAVGADSVHMGIMMPPELAASTGTSGMRMDMPMSMMGAGNPLLSGLMDSVSKALVNPTYHSLGSTATVAGVRCAEWIMVSGIDTMRTCVIPTPPELTALQEKMNKMTGMKEMLAQLPGMADMQRKAYDGKAMTPIRAINGKAGTTMELESFFAGAPNPATFELPADLQPMPFPGKPGGGSPPR